MGSLTSAQIKLQKTARRLAVSEIKPRAAEVDETELYPWDNVAKLTEAGFMGMTIPREYGGRAFSFLDSVIVIEEFSRVCGVTGRIVVEGNMGAIGAVMKYGSEDQKKLVSDLVLSGDKPAICITEPQAGSAATEMQTTATKKGNYYVINGMKHWITGGGVSKRATERERKRFSSVVVSCVPTAPAIISLVPTPSVPATRIGSEYPAALRSNMAPKPPRLDATPLRIVDFTAGPIAETRSLPASMSTPASL